MRRAMLASSLLILGTGLVRAQQPGDRVVVIHDNVPVKMSNRTVDTLNPGVVLSVRKVDRDWLFVCHTKPGWIQKSHVIAFDRAIAHFTAQIQRDPRNPALYVSRGAFGTVMENMAKP